MPVAHESALLFIPKPERERLEAGEQCDGFHRLKQRLGFVATLQIVIRNSRAQMVDVMEADVTGEPLQHLGQFVERTSLQCR